MDLEWNPGKEAGAHIAFAIGSALYDIPRQVCPDLLDLFPFKGPGLFNEHVGDGWIACRVIDNPRGSMWVGGQLKDQTEIKYLDSTLTPFQIRPPKELRALLGPDWFGFDRFTYVGPFRDNLVSWPDIEFHIKDFLRELVLPVIEERNRTRVLRAVPTPPQFNTAAVLASLWILESESKMIQGSAVCIGQGRLLTAAHSVFPDTIAFRPDHPEVQHKVIVEKSDERSDLAILKVEAAISYLHVGSADNLGAMDHILVAGFPNYRVGDLGVTAPGLVVGFRTIRGVRRLLTNAGIVAGMSGGPAIDKENKIVGICITGADKMQNLRDTEDQSIAPIDILL